MKKAAMIFSLFSALILLNGCGLGSKLKNLTQTANNLLETINSVVEQIDTKVETGELTKEVGSLIDERLNNLAQIIETTLQNNGGFLFDQVNGTLDNVFGNISQLLDQIKKGILDDSLPMLINQLSSAIQMNINLIASSVEDIIVLSFGNVFILVDKTVNSIVIISSIVLLSIGLLIFIIMLFRKKKEFTAFRAIGLFLMFVYLGFFLTMILSNRVRGNIIAGFNLGIKYTGTEVQPKITSVFPENFTFGTNDKIYLYGRHLNKIDTLRIVLRTGNQVKYTFPENNIIVASQNRIVLGNFNTWQTVVFDDFKKFLGPSESGILNTAQYKRFAQGVNKSINPHIIRMQNMVLHNIQPLMNQPAEHAAVSGISAAPPAEHAAVTPGSTVTSAQYTAITTSSLVTRKNITEIQNIRKNAAELELGAFQAQFILGKLKDFFVTKYSLPEGDYGIAAFDNLTEIESPQLITISYPLPPAPLPDIFPMEIKWTGPEAVSGRATGLSVKLGFSHPEEIKNNFNVRITSSPVLPTLTINVPMGVVSGALASKQAVVTTNQFTIPNHGNYVFTATADYNNHVQEENEGNNTISSSLSVKRYVYDLDVTYSTFMSKQNMDDWPYPEDEYRVTIRTSVTGHPDWEIKYNKDGEPGNVYSINESRRFNNLVPGHLYTFYSSVYEADDGSKDGDDYMGEKSVSHYLTTDIKNLDVVQNPILLENNYYKITGQYTLTRRIQ